MMDSFSTSLRRHALALLGALAFLLPGAGRAQEIIINEMCAANSNTVVLAEYPEYFPDYVELYNNSGRDIDLGLEGWSITDDLKATNKYRFPIGLIFPADAYMLVLCDSESPTNFPGLDIFYNQHTGFNLDAKGGENIALFKTAGRVFVTSNAFGIQLSGLSVSRFPGANAGTPFVLSYPTPCGGTVPCLTNAPYTNAFGSQFSLKINEWVCTNVMAEDWIEVFNPETNIVELSGLVFIDNRTGRLLQQFGQVGWIRPVPGFSYIGPQSFLRFWCDDLASKDADHLDFSLSSCSDCQPHELPANGILDEINIYAPDRVTRIDHAIVGAQLYRRPGFSQGRIPDGETNIFTFSNPTPEDSNVAPIPEINITELLAHVDPPLEDALELQNVTSTNVDIGNWWLTDNRFNPKKYRIPAGTIVSPGGFIVFYEYQFNNPATALQPFNFNSARGGDCYLFKGDAAGNVLGFRKGVTFGPSLNGVSFGRHVASDGNVEFVPMCDLSLGTSVRAGQDPLLITQFRTGQGATNPPLCQSPVAINEIFYHPPDRTGVTNNSIDEFVELRNVTSANVPLYFVPRDQGEIDNRYFTNGWKIDGVIRYDFDPAPFPFLVPNEYILLVNFDPTNQTAAAEFRSQFTPPIPPAVRLFGPYRGRLSNASGSVRLERPDAPQAPGRPDAGLTPYVLVERVQYADTSPWPTNGPGGIKVDGGGASLQRRYSYEFGNDPTNWFGDLPTPGRYNSPDGREKPYPYAQPRDYNGSPLIEHELAFPTRGDAPIATQWYRNGVPIPGATDTNLVITASGATIGNYHAIASNPAGSTTSRVASVTVNCPFVFSTIVAAFGPAGGATNITVNGTNGCFWTVGALPGWITLTSANSFEGTDTFSFEVAPYTGATFRTAAVQVAEQTFTVMQSAADSIPPTVTISGTMPGARVTSPAVVLKGGASDNFGISRIEMSIGSRPFETVSHSRAWQAGALLDPGTNLIRVRSFDIVGNVSAIKQRSIFFASPTPLNLVINGSGKVAVAPAASGLNLEIGRNYTLTATPNAGNVFSNWTDVGDAVLGASNKLTFNMRTGLVIRANFVPNPFLAAQGMYNGLFYIPTDVQHSNAGYFKLTVTSGGGYSGPVRIGGASYSVSGKFDLNGLATNTVLRTNRTTRTGLPPLTIVWNLGLNGQNAVTGEVNSAGWSAPAPLHGDRAVFNTTYRAPAGRYTVIIPPDTSLAGSAPQGYGYGTAVLAANGTLTFMGTLADGTKVTQAVPVADTNRWAATMWPLYAQLYANRGLLIGWVNTNSLTNDISGTLRWIRPPATTPKYYTNGFIATVQLDGSIYRPPATGTRILNLTHANVSLWDGNLLQPSTNLVALGLNNLVTYSGPNTLTLRFTLASGLFTGTYKQAGTTRTVTFNGAVHRRGDYGAGNFLGTNVTGGVFIEPASAVQ